MKKKVKNELIDELHKLNAEMVIDKGNEVFKDSPENYKEELAKIGFKWFDDEYPNEIEVENHAVPENQNQSYLVAYLDGDVELPDRVLEAFFGEKDLRREEVIDETS